MQEMECFCEISDRIQFLCALQQIISNMKEENIDFSVRQTMDLFDKNFPYSFNLIISMLLYATFSCRRVDANTYMTYLKLFQNKKEEGNIDIKIIEIFVQYLSRIRTQESYYLLENMIEQNLIDSNIIKNIHTKYFAHHKTIEEGKKIFLKIHFVNHLSKTLRNYQKMVGSSTNDWFMRE